MQNDVILVKQTLSGNHEAFHRLIIEYQANIYALILSWVKNPDDAKELVQDVFFEAYRDLGSLRNPERFYFWLRQIARHHCQSWLNSKREFVPLNDDIVAKTPSADETLILRETLAKVMQAIDELPETEKRLIKERYLDESSYDELQAKHGLSYKALSMRLLRAKQKVRASVKKALAGVGVLTWRKMLSGGVEAVKISAKVKIVAIGVAGVLVLGGVGVIVWDYNQSIQDAQNLIINPEEQQMNQSINQRASIARDIAKNVDKSVNKQKAIEEAENDNTNKVKTNKLLDLNVKASADSNPQTTTKEPPRKETREEFFQRYMKITRSPEFLAQIKNEAEPIQVEFESIRKEADSLAEEEKRLEYELIAVSEKDRQKLQSELEATRTKHKLIIKHQNETSGRIMDTMEAIALRYFTKEELDIALEEKAKRGMVFVLPDQSGQ